jgi:uncharacterized protein
MTTIKDDIPHLVDAGTSELSGIGTEIRRQLPHLSIADVGELAAAVAHLVDAFQPKRIYVFGSQARGTPTANSDVDLLVLVATSDQLPHQRAQAGYTAVGAHRVPLDILVMTQHEFDARLPAVASLPATVVREGRTLYAAAA